MKKLLTTLAVITFLFSTTSFIKAEEKNPGVRKEKEIGCLPPRQLPREGLKKVIRIRKKMRQIEIEVIKNDPELQQLQREIVELHKQMRGMLDEKLADNEEYQELKEQLEEMKQEWKRKWQKHKKDKGEKGKKDNQ